MNIKLEYQIKNHIVFVFNEYGDLESLHINGVDKSSNGDSIDHALAVVHEAGIDMQKDISVEVDRQIREACYQ